MSRYLVPATVFVFFLAACGDDDRGSADAGGSGFDSGTPGRDAGRDAGTPDAGGGRDAGGGDSGGFPPWPECDTPCGAGEICCPVGLTAECIDEPADGMCPLPDLTVSVERAAETAVITWEYFEDGDCAIVEGCIAEPGWRRLLRFGTYTPNIGTRDLYLGRPSTSNPNFVYSDCHMHYHFEGYADYRLFDGTTEVGTGHKQAFCLLDSERFLTSDPTVSRAPMYNCSNQGIQRGWGDEYHAGLDCQWIDVTDVEPGDYTLQITINQGRVLPELDYENNRVMVPMTVPPDVASDPTEACSRRAEGLGRDCGWTALGTFMCTAGEMLEVGCGSMCMLGSCGGDPMLRICEGDSACVGRDSLATDDDTCGGTCPLTSFRCPASGQYTVLGAPYETGRTASCTVEAR
jgi:hypothetical protein